MPKQVVTVMGPIAPEELGVTLTHEHILLDMNSYNSLPQEATTRAMAREKLDIRHLGKLRRLAGANEDNNRLDDINLAVEELLEFKKAGGKSVVELSCIGLARDVVGLKAVAALTGLNIIAPCGYYKGAMHPPSLKERSIEDITKEFITELTVGIGNTGIRAGVIGELGTGQPLYTLPPTVMDMTNQPDLGPTEEKVLRAAGRAQVETGAPISIHIYNFRPNRLAHHVLDVLEEEGANLEKVVISHLDSRPDVPYVQSIADRGAFIEFDTFGIEFYIDSIYSQFARDTDRIALLLEMINRGYTSQILISQDVCWKTLLVRYGGWGYAHISRHIEPRLRHLGVSDKVIHTIRVENPARWLAF